MTGHVFQSGQDLVIGNRIASALEAANGSNAHTAHEIGIFAERFFNPPPSWIKRDIDDRRQDVVDTADPNFACRDGINTFEQFRVKRTCERNRLREGRRISRLKAMQAFFVEQRRNAEPRFFDHPLLDSIGELDRFTRRAGRHASHDGGIIHVLSLFGDFHAHRVLWAGKTADPMRIGSGHFFR